MKPRQTKQKQLANRIRTSLLVSIDKDLNIKNLKDPKKFKSILSSQETYTCKISMTPTMISSVSQLDIIETYDSLSSAYEGLQCSNLESKDDTFIRELESKKLFLSKSKISSLKCLQQKEINSTLKQKKYELKLKSFKMLKRYSHTFKRTKPRKYSVTKSNACSGNSWDNETKTKDSSSHEAIEDQLTKEELIQVHRKYTSKHNCLNFKYCFNSQVLQLIPVNPKKSSDNTLGRLKEGDSRKKAVLNHKEVTKKSI